MSNPQKLQVQPLEPVQHGVGSIRRQIFTRHCRPGYVPFSLAHHVPSVPADDVVDLGRAHMMIVPSAQIKPEFLAPQQVPAFTPHRPVQPKRDATMLPTASLSYVRLKGPHLGQHFSTTC